MHRLSRRWLIIASLVGHLTLAFGLFVSGVWHIEQLPTGRHVTAALATFSPPAAAAGGAPLAARKVEIVRKRVTTLVQPVPRPVEMLAQTPATDPGPGVGSGGGSGSGDDPTGTGGCLVAPCGGDPAPTPIPPTPAVTPPTPPRPAFIPPVVMEALRISGETQIHPPVGVANEMLRDAHTRVTGGFRVCLAASGDVASVTMVLSTHYPAYDALLADGLRSWRYRPYLVDGRPTAVCGNVTFIYAMH